MAIQVEEIVQRSFTNWEELYKYVKEENNKYIRVPFEEFYQLDAKFSNGFFGSNGRWIKFNKEGMKTLCKLLQLPYHYLEKATEDGLVSNVLNSYLSNSVVKATLRNYQIVLDELNLTVSGLVSRTNVLYSNFTFLENLTRLYPEILQNYSLKECHILNTNLFIRLLSHDFVSPIEGRSDEGCKVGLQFSNGMTGNSATKAKYYINRTTTDQSIVMPSAHGIVKHTGVATTFLKRLAKNFTPVVKSVIDLPNKITTLALLDFDLGTIVKLDGTKFVYSIFPLTYCEETKRNKLNSDEKLSFDQKMIETYIGKSINSKDYRSMLDFVFLLSDYVSTQDLSEKIIIEEKSGDLASWILENQNNFSTQSELERIDNLGVDPIKKRRATK